MRFSLAAMSATLTLAISAVGIGDDSPSTIVDPLTAKQRAKLSDDLEQALQTAQQKVDADPRNIDGYSQRADALFFLGRFKAAVADYDQMMQLDPKLADSHWRRGIALFYADRFRDAAAQFESYHSFDQVDRENGIWRYLSQHKAYGREKAREGLLKYEKDDREPFPSVYKLFAGSMTPQNILEPITASELSATEREKRLFYAHLYIGLNHAVEGELVAAQQHLRLSTLNNWGPVAGYGPHYMWHVGRLHEHLLRAKLMDRE